MSYGESVFIMNGENVFGIVYGALATVMGGQQVCIQTFRPCNDGGVIVTTQQEIFFFFPRKVDLARN